MIGSVEGDEVLKLFLCFLPIAGVMKAGLADEELFISGGGICLEVIVVERLSTVKEAELKDEVFCVEAEALFKERLGVSSSEAFLGSEPQLFQMFYPEGEVINISRAPHNHLVGIPAPPVFQLSGRGATLCQKTDKESQDDNRPSFHCEDFKQAAYFQNIRSTAISF